MRRGDEERERHDEREREREGEREGGKESHCTQQIMYGGQPRHLDADPCGGRPSASTPHDI